MKVYICNLNWKGRMQVLAELSRWAKKNHKNSSHVTPNALPKTQNRVDPEYVTYATDEQTSSVILIWMIGTSALLPS